MIITIQKGGIIMLPPQIKNKPNFKVGKRFDIVFSSGMLNIVPEIPNADDEYTPKQRKIIDASLKKALQEVREGKVYGPFNSAREMKLDFYKRHKNNKK